MAGNFEAVAKQFVEFYYQAFDTDRTQLAGLYRDHSMLTFEGAPLQGRVSIGEKLTSLPFQKVAHQVDTLDAQPSSEQGGILVMVTGKLKTDDDAPKSFVQVFQLLPEGGSYFVLNDKFRLVYAA